MRISKSKPTIFPLHKKTAAIKRPGVNCPPQATRLVADAFEAVPTIFGRLVLAAYLLHRDTGLYVCPLASVAYGYDEVHLLLCDTHCKLLGAWLAMTAEQQVSDLQSYLSSVDDDTHALAASILRTRSYGALLPIRVDPADRKNFMTGVGRALKTHCNAPPLKANGAHT